MDGLNKSEPTSADFPLVLTTGRVRDQWHTMTKTGKVSKLNQHIRNAFVELHPEDARDRGIEEGQLVNIISTNGKVKVSAKLTLDIKKGVVFMPMHWGKILNRDAVRANNLTTNLVDAKSKEPDFKFTAVQVERYTKKKERIILVGAGAGACKFIEEYRNLNQEDEIVVFSKEVNPFYNRILLPEYYTGQKAWSHLVRMDENVMSAFNITVHTGNAITHIDKKNKIVTDAKGLHHNYDKLILATGSRPNVPRGIEVDYKGIFSIRSKEDADRLKNYMTDKQSVLVIGGGLLGLEIASSLMEAGQHVTIAHRNNFV